MSARDIHIFLKPGLRNLCGARSTTKGVSYGETFHSVTAIDEYPRALRVVEDDQEKWKICFSYGEAMYEAVPVAEEERFCSPCYLINQVMKANGCTSRRAARRLLRANGGIK